MGVLLLDWSLLDVMLFVWIEGALVVLATGAKLLVKHPLFATLGIAISAPIVTVLLLLQLAFIVLWFGLDAARQDFFSLALGLPDLARRVLWGALALAAFQGVAFWLRFLRGPERALPWWRILAAPLAHVLTLQLVVFAAGHLVRAKADATGALVLLVVLKAAVDLALFAVEERLAPKSRPVLV